MNYFCRWVVVFVACLVAVSATGRRVSYDEAAAVAATFLRTDAGARRVSGAREAVPDAPYYIFQSPERFVIVAGDDRMPQVLAYSDSATLDAADMPPQLTALLAFYGDVYENIGSYRRAPVSTGDEILLKTANWSQTPPFSRMCPSRYTGCVATAMAILMKYHSFPRRGRGARSYEWNDSVLSFNFDTEFDWANMADSYVTYTNEAANAVASLMYACGVAVDMNYGETESGAQSPKAQYLAKYFRYSNDTQFVVREDYTPERWDELIMNELVNDRPVFYRGDSNEGTGHAFIIDGCDGNGLYHVNWGWGGSANGYFALTAMTPLPDHIYTYNQGMLINAAPAEEEYCPLLVDGALSYNNPGIVANDTVFANITNLINRDNESRTGAIGIGLCDGNGTVRELLGSCEYNIEPGDTCRAFSVAGLVSGVDAQPDDVLVPVYQAESGQWVPVAAGDGALTPVSAFAFEPEFVEIDWLLDRRLSLTVAGQRRDRALRNSCYDFYLVGDSTVDYCEVKINGQTVLPDDRGLYSIDFATEPIYRIETKAFPDAFTAVFKIDGEIVESRRIGVDETVVPPEVAEREGYTFSGWSDVPATMPARDIEICSYFTVNSYKLTFTLDGEDYADYIVDYGTPLTPEEVAEKEGYTFSGWRHLPDTMPAHDVEVSGTVDVDEYNICYIVDGEIFEDCPMLFGAEISHSPTPYKEGYSFAGWEGLPAIMPSHDIEVSARFNINYYRLTLYLNEQMLLSADYPFGAPVHVEAPEVEPGMAFSGWYEEIPATMPARDVDIHGSYSYVSSADAPVFNDDETVAVHTLDGKTLFRDVRWRDIAGRLAPGIYIVNGRKYIQL